MPAKSKSKKPVKATLLIGQPQLTGMEVYQFQFVAIRREPDTGLWSGVVRGRQFNGLRSLEQAIFHAVDWIHEFLRQNEMVENLHDVCEALVADRVALSELAKTLGLEMPSAIYRFSTPVAKEDESVDLNGYVVTAGCYVKAVSTGVLGYTVRHLKGMKPLPAWVIKTVKGGEDCIPDADIILIADRDTVLWAEAEFKANNDDNTVEIGG